jgi:hypothetical protein
MARGGSAVALLDRQREFTLKRSDRIRKLIELPTVIGNASKGQGSLAQRQMGVCHDKLNPAIREFGHVFA